MLFFIQERATNYKGGISTYFLSLSTFLSNQRPDCIKFYEKQQNNFVIQYNNLKQ